MFKTETTTRKIYITYFSVYFYPGKVQWHEKNRDNFRKKYKTCMSIESNGKMKRINGRA